MEKLALIAMLTAMMAGTALAGDLTPIGDLKRGTMVTIAGNAERILDTDEFRLADETGSVRVYVGPNWVPADMGESVIVAGFVDDGFGPLHWKFSASISSPHFS